MAIVVSLESTKGDFRPGLVSKFQLYGSKWRSFCSTAKACGFAGSGRWEACNGGAQILSFNNPTSSQLPGKHQVCFFILVTTPWVFLPPCSPTLVNGYYISCPTNPFHLKSSQHSNKYTQPTSHQLPSKSYSAVNQNDVKRVSGMQTATHHMFYWH